MVRDKKTVIILSILAVILLYFIAGDFLGGRNADNLSNENSQQGIIGINVGDIAPNFTLLDLQGNTVNLQDYRGKVVMLNFWSIN